VGDAVSRLDTKLPVPLFNSTYRVCCVSDAALTSLIEVAGPGRGPWWLGPSTTPAGAGAVLEEFGLRRIEEQHLMSASLEDTAEPDPAVAVSAARTPAERGAWATAYAGGRGLAPHVEAAWADVVTALGDGPLRHYVATVDGVPAASASVLLAEGVAGLYCVAAPPSWRERGLEEAVTRYALADARAAGYATAVAEVEPSAVASYRALGFRTQDVMRLYA
jgi:ribosomal protein S18 acetylase RimI-like enzyme